MLRTKTHRVRRVRGFPLVVFGALVLGATPLYWQSVQVCPGGRSCGDVTVAPSLGTVVGLQPGGGSAWVSLYWFCALAIGLIVTAYFYRLRARQSEVDVRAWPVALAGAVVCALLVASSPGVLRDRRLPSWITLSDLHLRGTTPLLVLAIVIVGLALVERSWALGAFSAVFVFFALLANLYDLDNLVTRLGWWLTPQATSIPNVAIPGVVLVVGGVVFALLDRWLARSVLVGANP
jgi:hypothetical protein